MIQIRNIKIGEGIPSIIVPIVSSNMEDILSDAKSIDYNLVNAIEWRADFYLESNYIEVLKNLREIVKDKLIIFTFRTKDEGGNKSISSNVYKDLLMEVSKTNLANFVDIEVFKDDYKELIKDIHTTNTLVIGSNHNFEYTYESNELIKRLNYINEVGSDILKIAMMPSSEDDVKLLLETTKKYSSLTDKPLITMSMSNLGKISRIECEKYGSAMSFGSNGKSSAPGQIDYKELSILLKKVHEELSN